MIKLSKCCLTCGHVNFGSNMNSGKCKYWAERLGNYTWIAKPMVCEHWFDASTAEKKWGWERPERRNSYWNRDINKLNKIIFDKTGAL